jgi:CHAT domain-containing protein
LASNPESFDTFRGLAAISQAESTAGYPRLPGTYEEVNAIQSGMGNERFSRLDESQATKESVLKAMGEHSSGWIHLACHGTQDRSEPTKSALILSDGPLELEQITDKFLPHARFAFLYACQTAAGDENLPDEVVHLAAGMMLAGYRSVIAIMWSIDDRDGPVVADEVYKHLMMNGTNIEAGQAAYALHKAVKVLRERSGETNFPSWVPFIHLGVRMYVHPEASQLMYKC